MHRTCSHVVAPIAAVAVLLAASAEIALAETVTKTNNTPAPQGGVPSSTVGSSVTFAAGDFTGGGVVTGVKVDVNMMPASFFNTYWEQTQLRLISPTGTIVMLQPFNTFAHGGVGETRAYSFQDGGTALPAGVGTPVAGTTYAPSSPLSAFNGEVAFFGTGVWTLSYTNGANVGGQITSFSLTLTTTSATPEPGTFALFGLGAVGLGIAARRRRRKAR